MLSVIESIVGEVVEDVMKKEQTMKEMSLLEIHQMLSKILIQVKRE